METTSLQLATFFIGDRFFGVDVTRVQEVIRHQEMTRVPLASPVIRGLMNLRGQIVTALDMRTRLGFPPRSSDEPPMNVVVRANDGFVSLLVDEIGDVVEVDDAAWEETPETLTSSSRDLIRGVYKLKDRLLLVLDAERAIAVGAAEQPETSRER